MRDILAAQKAVCLECGPEDLDETPGPLIGVEIRPERRGYAGSAHAPPSEREGTADQSVPLFSRFTRRELSALASEADELTIPERKGADAAGSAGAGVHGHRRRGGPRSQERPDVNELGGAGDFTGEIALLVDVPRRATVRTTTETTVLVLTDRAFRRVANKIPSVRKSLLTALLERLQADAL